MIWRLRPAWPFLPRFGKQALVSFTRLNETHTCQRLVTALTQTQTDSGSGERHRCSSLLVYFFINSLTSQSQLCFLLAIFSQMCSYTNVKFNLHGRNSVKSVGTSLFTPLSHPRHCSDTRQKGREKATWYFNGWFECAKHSTPCVYSCGISWSAWERLYRWDQGRATNTGVLDRQREFRGVCNPSVDVTIWPLWNAIRNWQVQSSVPDRGKPAGLSHLPQHKNIAKVL